VSFIWLLWLALWLVAAPASRRARVRDTIFSRIIQVVVSAAVYILMFSRSLPLGWLDDRWIPRVPLINAPGILLTAAGLAFSFWARVRLGRNWSGVVRIGEGHVLIRSGPYARIRHPIYSGLLLAFLATALVMGNWRSIAATLVALLGLTFKAKREEKLLAQEFGAAFEDYRRESGFLLPKFPPRQSILSPPS
jgi:protein-S-isoprenylcysteine O-methyltransferase Ste14